MIKIGEYEFQNEAYITESKNQVWLFSSEPKYSEEQQCYVPSDPKFSPCRLTQLPGDVLHVILGGTEESINTDLKGVYKITIEKVV